MKRKEIIGEMGPELTTQQKIRSINAATGEVELTDPSGKVTKVKQTDLQQDPKDPTGKKLKTTLSAPKNEIKPGAQVSVTTQAPTTTAETVDRIKKLSGLK